VVNGAYTSQVSINQISQFKNIKGSLVGHSEVRSLLNDTDEKINQKIQNLTTNQLQAIFCIGETKEQYEQQQTNQIIEEQVKKGLSDITSEQLKYVIIAYEPI
jgi:triosephosphate isomerase